MTIADILSSEKRQGVMRREAWKRYRNDLELSVHRLKLENLALLARIAELEALHDHTDTT